MLLKIWKKKRKNNIYVLILMKTSVFGEMLVFFAPKNNIESFVESIRRLYFVEIYIEVILTCTKHTFRGAN